MSQFSSNAPLVYRFPESAYPPLRIYVYFSATNEAKVPAIVPATPSRENKSEKSLSAAYQKSFAEKYRLSDCAFISGIKRTISSFLIYFSDKSSIARVPMAPYNPKLQTAYSNPSASSSSCSNAESTPNATAEFPTITIFGPSTVFSFFHIGARAP